jgi:hypothetical protein
MKNTFILIASIFFLSAINQNISAQHTAIEHYTNKGLDCAIFPDTYPTELGGKAFIPSHEDVNNAWKALTDNFKDLKCDNKDDKNEIIKNLAKYKVQIFGYADKSGNKILFMNCFRNDGSKDKDLAITWLTEMIEVQDGGTYFWTIKYNLATKELFDFKENGNG